jgi:nicotinamide-nucleotide amidase
MRVEIRIGKLLRDQGQTLSIAESCTGGLVSDRITNVPGSSDYFEGSVICYSNRAKVQHLRIPLKTLERFGAVSSEIAGRMAQGIRKAFHTEFGLSTTGVAGPTGGTKKTPVGTVFIGFSNGKRTWVKKVDLKGTRREIKKEAAEKAILFLQEYLTRHAHHYKR